MPICEIGPVVEDARFGAIAYWLDSAFVRFRKEVHRELYMVKAVLPPGMTDISQRLLQHDSAAVHASSRQTPSTYT